MGAKENHDIYKIQCMYCKNELYENNIVDTIDSIPKHYVYKCNICNKKIVLKETALINSNISRYIPNKLSQHEYGESISPYQKLYIENYNNYIDIMINTCANNKDVIDMLLRQVSYLEAEIGLQQ